MQALLVAEQYPQYAGAIAQAAKQSFIEGSLTAFLIGIGVIGVGAIAVWIGLPNREQERKILAARAGATEAS